GHVCSISHLVPYTTLFRSSPEGSGRRRLQDALGDVEVRVHALDIVRVLELLHQSQDLARGALVLDLKCCLRHERDLGRGNLDPRSEEHTSELQSRVELVCR